MAKTDFDNINSLEKDSSVINYEEYFGEEELTEEQKQRRIDLANEIEQVMLFAFSLIVLFTEEDNYDYTIVVEETTDRFLASISAFVALDEVISTYAYERAKQVVSSTVDALNTAYFLSRERATVIAANESDTILNRDDYMKAIMQGKTKKTWVDVKDKRERKDHLAVGGKTIGITELFHVGNDLMLYPHDMSADSKQLINCRCQCRYS